MWSVSSKSLLAGGFVVLASALGLGGATAWATSIPFGTADGGIAVYYNDNGSGEVPTNQAYFRAQFSLSNTNGAEYNFDPTPLPGTGGAISWASIFQSVPDQFGLDAVVNAPTNDLSVTTPTLTAYENTNNTLGGRAAAGTVTWAISGYTGATDGPADPANGIINSLFRGGTGPNDGGAFSVTVTPVSQVGTLFTVDVSGELISDGLIHWYNPATPNSPVGNFELTGKLFFSGTLTYDSAGPGETSTNLVDFYAGTIDVEAEVICAPRFVNVATGSNLVFGVPNTCRNSLFPCKTIQQAVDVACPADIVNVAAGTYPEQVEIAKPLTIQGAGKAVTIIKPTTVTANTTSLTDASSLAAIVLVDDAVDVFINDVKVDGAPSGAAIGGCSPGLVGVYYRNSSGVIDDSHVSNVLVPAAPGCQGLVGILVHSAPAGAADVDISDSMVDNYGKNGITCSVLGTVCDITNNVVTGRGPVPLGDAAQNGIQLGASAVGTIVGNTVTGNDYLPQTVCSTGILTFDNAGLTIKDNVLNGNFCDLLTFDTDSSLIERNVIDPAGAFPFSVIGDGNDVRSNRVSGSSGFGIYVDGINNSLSCNKITDNVGGIQFDSSFAGAGSGPGTPNTASQNFIAGNGVGVDATALDPGDPAIDAKNNWWGCAAGPGNPGCDTATGNVDATSPRSSPPPCVVCSVNADCANGLTCDGSEVCNAGTCQAGPPVVCAPPTQCQISNVCQEPSGTCASTSKPDGVLCSDGQVCTVSDTCQSGSCVAGPGGDADDDGDCDSEEAACGCNGLDGTEVCVLPNRLVGLPGSAAGEVLLNWYSPTVRKAQIASDPACAGAGAGLCSAGRCTAGKVYDLCTTNADCDQPANTCRVIVNYADTDDNRLLYARFGRTDVPGFVAGTPSPTSPIGVAYGCSKKVDVVIPPKRSNRLKIFAVGTIDLRLRSDRDVLLFKR